MRHAFWLYVLRFAYRRLKLTDANMHGVPTIRDPLSRCDAYAPRRYRLGDFECWGDGHYLCKACAHYQPEEELHDRRMRV